MNATQQAVLPARLATVVWLARLLERLERSEQRVSADQYRVLVQRLAEALRTAAAEPGLDAVLTACPAAAELYENLQYEHAGLCRSPLDWALSAELQARDAISHVAGRSAGRSGGGVATAG
ncbi:hypothetical protein [Caldimonas brevitalea]|uniref:Uncharacterized protein n=1 Tax=Caldimonas brevitalea TaxID=413882 RepID=A0A0G3BLF0_9BURK|nr:hypothetical protein [Caldimonas brevitalea]AKJ28226.1 hypothetical protein AAW51_1535 [Caldimonas brevitalea]